MMTTCLNGYQTLIKVLFGALLGFGLGYWATILKERRERKQLHKALYQELSNCYEAISYFLEHKGEDLQFLKTKLKHE